MPVPSQLNDCLKGSMKKVTGCFVVGSDTPQKGKKREELFEKKGRRWIWESFLLGTPIKAGKRGGG